MRSLRGLSREELRERIFTTEMLGAQRGIEEKGARVGLRGYAWAAGMSTLVENNKDAACPTRRRVGDGDGRMVIRLHR
jgi:hypothetical protein